MLNVQTLQLHVALQRSLSLVIETVQGVFAPAECQEGFDPSGVYTLPRSTGAQDLLSQQ